MFLEEFRAARAAFGTQEQVAKRIGQTQTFISKCERGERRMDAIELIAFCNAFGIDPAEFIRRVHMKVGKSPKIH
jgi:transcriptional regulator with XRE-family HTH domain